MDKKIGRNDPCYCGSGKKYKNCHMQIEKEQSAAKYTASGKRKIKAKVITMADKSLSVFSRAASTPQVIPEPKPLGKLKFKTTQKDFRQIAQEEPLPFPLPVSEEASEKPEERERHLPEPGEEFKSTTEDFRKKQD